MIIEITLHDDTNIKFSEDSNGILIEFRQWNSNAMHTRDEMKIHLDVEMEELERIITILRFFQNS